MGDDGHDIAVAAPGHLAGRGRLGAAARNRNPFPILGSCERKALALVPKAGEVWLISSRSKPVEAHRRPERGAPILAQMGRAPDENLADEARIFRNPRAYYSFMWTQPGNKLLFMGQEFARTRE